MTGLDVTGRATSNWHVPSAAARPQRVENVGDNVVRLSVSHIVPVDTPETIDGRTDVAVQAADRASEEEVQGEPDLDGVWLRRHVAEPSGGQPGGPAANGNS